MEVRYVGFDQQQSARSYRFDVVEKGQPTKRLIVTADLSLFHTHGVGIQEGPALSASKLVKDLESDFAGHTSLPPRICSLVREYPLPGGSGTGGDVQGPAASLAGGGTISLEGLLGLSPVVKGRNRAPR